MPVMLHGRSLKNLALAQLASLKVFTRYSIQDFIRPSHNCEFATDTKLQEPRHPAFLAVAERRTATVRLRVADTVTAFAFWMLVFEKSPWP
jgi:hypothetical protein